MLASANDLWTRNDPRQFCLQLTIFGAQHNFFGNRPDFCFEPGQIDRLFEIIDGADFDCLNCRTNRRIGSHENYFGIGIESFYLPEKTQTVDARHAHVGYYQMKNFFFQQFKSILGVDAHLRPVPHAANGFGQKLCLPGIIIDNKNGKPSAHDSDSRGRKISNAVSATAEFTIILPPWAMQIL